MEAILRVDDLRLSFSGLAVLQGITLSVVRNHVIALIGPNGAGKTAALNCISGIYLPQAVAIHFGEKSQLGLAPREIAHAVISSSFKILMLFGCRTVT